MFGRLTLLIPFTIWKINLPWSKTFASKTPSEEWDTNPRKSNKHGERKKSHRLVTYCNKTNSLCRPGHHLQNYKLY